jgi:uncharacterized protein YdaU (DUF1376 family)
MFHYPFHVGDYIADTAHLTIEEDIAYRRLLDHYYTTEKPLIGDVPMLARRVRMADYAAVVRDVLNEFFKFDEQDECWHKQRCDEEIAKYKGFSEAGKRGAEKRWAKPPQDLPNDLPNGNQEPRTENREPLIQGADAPKSETAFPTCPHSKILELWKTHLPHLTQHRSWEGSRQATLRQRWMQAAKPSAYSPNGYKTLAEGLKWWDSFFAYIANDTKLAAGFESQGRTWKPDLEWIINATNFAKIIDGKYNK